MLLCLDSAEYRCLSFTTGLAQALSIFTNAVNSVLRSPNIPRERILLPRRHRHVLFIIPSLRGGGAERVIVTLLRHFDRSKFRLALAVVDMREAAYRGDVPEDVEIIDLGCARVRYALPKIIRLIWRRCPDVVFSTLGHLNLALAIIRPLLPDGVRYVARESIVVSEIIRHDRTSQMWGWAYRHFYRRFDAVVCQSHDMRDDLVVNFALPEERAVVINNPVDVERIRHLAAEPVVTGFEQKNGSDGNALIHFVTAGRLANQKGFDLIIRALALCGSSRFRLTILGEGPLLGDLMQLAQDRGVAPQVRFVGFQKNPYPFFARADAFVLSSRFEGFPNVVLEALACGTPVIATPAPGGVREILEGMEGGILAQSVTSETLADAMLRFQSCRTRPTPNATAPYEVSKIVRRYEHEFT